MVRNPFGVLQDLLAHAFYQYGLFISKNPRLFALAPLILTCILSLGAFRVRMEDDLRFLYSPFESLSRVEYEIHQEFSGDSLNNSIVSITLQAADETENLLTKEWGERIRHLNRFILDNMTVEIDGKKLVFGSSICADHRACSDSNVIAELFFSAFFSPKLRTDPRVKIDYPTMKFFDKSLFLPTHLYGVQLGKNNEMLRIGMVHLIFQIPSYHHMTSDAVADIFLESVKETMANKEKHFKSSQFSLSILKSEMSKNATYTVPFISLTILLLISFTVISCMTGDWVTSKPIEAMIGVLTSSMAIVSAAGLLFAMGEPFIYQVIVMPFLALAIGVDDVYVMLGAWQDTKRTLDPATRMALTLEEAGSAISVTSLTSILSFGIGAYSSTPAIAIFCRFVALAIAFDWFYQLTFFAAVMVLGGRREAAGYHCIFVWKRCSREEIEKAKRPDSVSPARHFFEHTYAPFICNPYTRIGMFFVYAAYILTAFYGCSLLRPSLIPSRLVVDDSPLIPYLHLAQNMIWAEGLIGRVYVNKAPDFAKYPEQVDRMLQMVKELESTPYSMGPNSTSFWLNDFNNYRQYFDNPPDRFYNTLKSFLEVSFNSHWESALKWTPREGGMKGDEVVTKFVFTTAFKISNWNVRTELLLMWRNITSKYPDFEALVFDENNFYSDQMLDLQNTILQSLGTAIITLVSICILFVAESSIVFWVVCTLVSMDIGTAGFLSLWGADLDPGTVVNILMSIGQCIDFSIHVGYRIYRSEVTDPDGRIKDALGAIGFPVLQAGLSSLLAIIVMILVPSNAVRMFARTAVLVVATGLFHGLFVLPVVIRCFASNPNHLNAKKKEPTNNNTGHTKAIAH